MKKNIEYLFFTLCFVLYAELLVGQDTMKGNNYNYSSFPSSQKEVTEELIKLTPKEFLSHPEFGILPYNSPCDDCIELVHKRTENSRFFVKKGSEGTQFYTQTAYGNIHYLENGYLLSYDPRLELKTDKIYTSEKQVTPIEFNLKEKYTSFKIADTKHFIFNNKLEMLHLENGIEVSFGLADWSNYTIGENGIYITNAWPNIDIEISTIQDRIKSNFIIKKNIGLSAGSIIIKDQWNIPENYTVATDNGYVNEIGLWEGSLKIFSNDSNKYFFEYGSGYAYDSSGKKENLQMLGYSFSNENILMNIPVSYLNKQNIIYPITIDPLVTSSATYTTGIMRFRYTGSFCGGANPDCSYNLTVAKPANSTLTGASFSAQYITSGGCFPWSCYMQEAGFFIIGPCDNSPTGVGWWGCGLPNPGTCSGTNINMFSTVSCLPPACSGNITFTMRNSYCWCSTGANCGASCHSMPNSSWSITLTGSTLETLGNTSTGNGSSIINAISCAGTTLLDPAVTNGVPPYSYSWVPGGQTTPTITVPNFPSGQVYTCTVTDACGQVRIATFTVNCPLPITLLNFEGVLNENGILLRWSTLSEENARIFSIERTKDAVNFYLIGEIPASNNSRELKNYSFQDVNPDTGYNYYRLKQIDYDGNYSYSKIIAFNNYIVKGEVSIEIVPNPTNGITEIIYNSYKSEKISISLLNRIGLKERFLDTDSKVGKNSYHFDLSNLPKGIYFVSLTNSEKTLIQKVVIQ